MTSTQRLRVKPLVPRGPELLTSSGSSETIEGEAGDVVGAIVSASNRASMIGCQSKRSISRAAGTAPFGGREGSNSVEVIVGGIVEGEMTISSK